MKPNGKQTEDIKEMVERVLYQRQNWSKHIAHTCCKCEKCTCGMHKCKISPPKMDLKPSNTTYHDSYQKRKSVGNFKHQKAEFQTYHPRQFIKKSEYTEEYYRKNAKLQSAKPEKHKDNLGLGGPNFASTTYVESYSPKKNPNPKTQMIKNPENLCNFGMKMNTKSHYRDHFNSSKKQKAKPQDPIKHKDNLKTEAISFIGGSSYMNDFNQKKPFKKDSTLDNFAPKNQYNSTHGLRPKSSYRCDYTQKKVIRCPAETCC